MKLFFLFFAFQDSLVPYSHNRQNAIRIKHLPAGTVQFETLIEENIKGVITKEAQNWNSRSPTKMVRIFPFYMLQWVFFWVFLPIDLSFRKIKNRYEISLSNGIICCFQSPNNGDKSPERGLINYQQGDVKKTIAYNHKDVDPKCSPRLGEQVEFNIVQVRVYPVSSLCNVTHY